MTVRASATQSLFMNVSEWSGVATLDILDSAVADTGSDGPSSAGILATKTRDLIVFSATTHRPNLFGSPGPEWTMFDDVATPVIVQRAWYQVADHGIFHPTVTITSTFWDAALAGLRASP